jgi:hypothetical protein
MLQRSPSKLAGAFGEAKRNRSNSEAGATLSTTEKQELLSRYLSNVEDLVKDLRTCAPFGGVIA